MSVVTGIIGLSNKRANNQMIAELFTTLPRDRIIMYMKIWRLGIQTVAKEINNNPIIFIKNRFNNNVVNSLFLVYKEEHQITFSIRFSSTNFQALYQMNS